MMMNKQQYANNCDVFFYLTINCIDKKLIKICTDLD